MVTFDDYPLIHVAAFTTTKSRVYQRKLIPTATLGQGRDETAGGCVITVQGEIRGDPDYALRIEELRRRSDNAARALDLEDGSPVTNAKLGPVSYSWDVERGVDGVEYSVTFYETS